MLTKNLKVVQVTFDALVSWPDEYKVSIGALLIACSQWEYIYELLWKDLNPDSTKTFEEIMKAADGKVVGRGIEKNLIAPLNGLGYIEIVKEIKQLEDTYRDIRHIIVHGFYHIHENNKLISRLSEKGDSVIGCEIVPGELLQSAEDINRRANILNSLRREKFHK